MRYFLAFVCIFLLLPFAGRADGIKERYLESVRKDVRSGGFLPSDPVVKFTGFGAIHGTAKTEEAELALIGELLARNDTLYYFPETDFCTAFYFQRYLDTGDKHLLKQLIEDYGDRVPQERSVEMFDKWVRLRALSTGKNIRVIGIDPVVNYRSTFKYLLEAVDSDSWKFAPTLRGFLADTKSGFGRSERLDNIITVIIGDTYVNPAFYEEAVADRESFGYLIENLRQMLGGTRGREYRIYDNYVAQKELYGFDAHPQFLRMGLFHLLKSRMNGLPSFLALLIEGGIYTPGQIYSVLAMLVESEVLWETFYDEEGCYSGFNTERGIGTMDMEDEHFAGIGFFKNAAVSDLTFFPLGSPGTPYGSSKDLITIEMSEGVSNWQPDAGCTLDYMDAVILVRNSDNNRPIYEMELPVD